MLGKTVFAAAVLALSGSAAMATTCAPYTYTLTNGTPADATQVMQDFSDILGCANTALAPLAGPSFTGNVGIATVTTFSRLTVLSANSAAANDLMFADDTAGDYRNSISNNFSSAAASGNGMNFKLGDSTVSGQNYVLSLNGNGGAAIGTTYAQVFLGSPVPPANGLIVQGKVGLGTASPSSAYELDVAGYVNTSALYLVGGVASLARTGGRLDVGSDTGYSSVALSPGATPQLTVLSSGNVGIGTTSPSALLTVAGDTLIGGKIENNRGSLTWNLYGSGNDFYLGTNASDMVEIENATHNLKILSGGITTTGSVGIGTSTITKTLTVGGDVRIGTASAAGCMQDYTGTQISGTCVSDAALKTVRGNVSDILDKFAALQLVRFNWNARAAALYANSTTALNTGFIAQAVQQQFPELVSVDAHGYRQLDYTTLSLYGLEAVKELKLAADSQARAIAGQRSEIQALIAANRSQAAALQALQAEVGALERRERVRTAQK